MRKKNESYADLMTLKEFKTSCVQGLFGDYDGFGFYSDGENYDPANKIYPSMMLTHVSPAWATHILWFNR